MCRSSPLKRRSTEKDTVTSTFRHPLVTITLYYRLDALAGGRNTDPQTFYDSVEMVRKEEAAYIEINRTAPLSLEEAEEVATGDRALVSIVASRPNRTS